MSAWLSNRTQSVCIEGLLSPPKSVLSGVLQGSVLGPLLFLLFINDLIDTIPPEAHPTLFADDLKIYSDLPVCLTTTSPGSAYCPLLQLSLLTIISNWSKLWQLSIASNKCSCLSISNKKSESLRLYIIDSLPIPQVESCCDLGILIDDRLSFSGPYTLCC